METITEQSQSQQHPCDIDLDLDISLKTYDGPLYELHQLAVQYTYNEDQIYTVTGNAIIPVIQRMTDRSLVEMLAWVDILHRSVQQETGLRNLSITVDQDLSIDLDNLEL